MFNFSLCTTSYTLLKMDAIIIDSVKIAEELFLNHRGRGEFR